MTRRVLWATVALWAVFIVLVAVVSAPPAIEPEPTPAPEPSGPVTIRIQCPTDDLWIAIPVEGMPNDLS